MCVCVGVQARPANVLQGIAFLLLLLLLVVDAVLQACGIGWCVCVCVCIVHLPRASVTSLVRQALLKTPIGAQARTDPLHPLLTLLPKALIPHKDLCIIIRNPSNLSFYPLFLDGVCLDFHALVELECGGVALVGVGGKGGDPRGGEGEVFVIFVGPVAVGDPKGGGGGVDGEDLGFAPFAYGVLDVQGHADLITVGGGGGRGGVCLL